MRDWSKKKLSLLVIALILLIATIGFLLLQSSKHKTSETAAETVTYSTDTPDETKPDDTYTWRGGPNDPKKIIVPSLNIDAYIQNVGVDQKKEIAVPTNVHIAGWFVDSVRPGEKGLSIIDGHLNGRQADGVFNNLEAIEKGTTYSIEFGDGSKKTFKVLSTQVVDLDKAAGVLFSQNPKVASQVNLITCGGTFDQQARLYDKRVIVSSKLVTT